MVRLPSGCCPLPLRCGLSFDPDSNNFQIFPAYQRCEGQVCSPEKPELLELAAVVHEFDLRRSVRVPFHFRRFQHRPEDKLPILQAQNFQRENSAIVCHILILSLYSSQATRALLTPVGSGFASNGSVSTGGNRV